MKEFQLKLICSILALFLIFSIVLNIFLYILCMVTLEESALGRVHVYGWATEVWTNQSVPDVTILFFLGRYEEIPYIKSSINVTTDTNGFYEASFQFFTEDRRLEVAASKVLYHVFGHPVQEIELQSRFHRVYEVNWNVNFTMVREAVFP